jgi:hypothetical protein
LSRIGSRSILESSDIWCGHHVHSTWTQSNIYGTRWRGTFAPTILHLQTPGSCGWLSRWHGSAYLQRSSVHLWYRRHVGLPHFAGLEGVIHDTRYLSHDFWLFSILNHAVSSFENILVSQTHQSVWNNYVTCNSNKVHLCLMSDHSALTAASTWRSYHHQVTLDTMIIVLLRWAHSTTSSLILLLISLVRRRLP